MFRLALTRLVATSRITINSSKVITHHHHHRYFLRNLSSQSNDNISQSKIPLANINKGEESRRMGIQFICKVCDHKLQKTFTRQSYENGVVIIRCDSCSNLHLIADNLGWFKDLTQNGKFK
jgi:protein import protein ZIM17